MTHDYLFDGEIVRLAFVIGIVLSMALYEWRQLTTGSIVVPGHLGVFILQPWALVACLVNAVLSFWLVHRVLPRVISMSARAKFSALIVTSVGLHSLEQWFVGFGTGASGALSMLIGIGYVIPALVAHDMARQGIARSLSAVMGTSLATGVCIIGFTWLAPETATAPSAVVPLESAFLVDGMFIAMLLSAVSVVALQSRHGLAAGGFIGPAYLGFMLVHPAQLAFLAVLTPVTYFTTTHILMRRMILFGRRKFAAMLLVGSLYSWGGMLLVERCLGISSLPFSSPTLSVISVVLIGLLANDADRVGWSGVLRGTVLAVSFTVAGTLLVLEVAEHQRPSVLLSLSTVTAAAALVIFVPRLTVFREPSFGATSVRALAARNLRHVGWKESAEPEIRRPCWVPVCRASLAVGLALVIGVALLPLSLEAPLFLGVETGGGAPRFRGRHEFNYTSRPSELAVTAKPLPSGLSVHESLFSDDRPAFFSALRTQTTSN